MQCFVDAKAAPAEKEAEKGVNVVLVFSKMVLREIEASENSHQIKGGLTHEVNKRQ